MVDAPSLKSSATQHEFQRPPSLWATLSSATLNTNQIRICSSTVLFRCTSRSLRFHMSPPKRSARQLPKAKMSSSKLRLTKPMKKITWRWIFGMLLSLILASGSLTSWLLCHTVSGKITRQSLFSRRVLPRSPVPNATGNSSRKTVFQTDFTVPIRPSFWTHTRRRILTLSSLAEMSSCRPFMRNVCTN